ncbi:MAG: glycerophosphodiester phosphodiesterase [Candidatus Latescibacteria bacterium]|jgi:glycerophosphoryl diester phosphodiesterase|nr:glycerophosphodiester phosphodiesterase [Candidatus Latescibacterota bacterium]
MFWKWCKRSILGLAGAGILIIAVLAATSEPVTTHPFTDTDEFLVIAHRGGRGQWPENTMQAFRKASESGVDVLEMDIQATRDGTLIVMHDSEVNRTTNGSGRVTDLTFGELQKLDAGYWWTDDDGASYPFRGVGVTVPSFQSVLETFPDIRLIVELKQTEPSIVDRFVSAVKESGTPDQILVASFQGSTIQEVQSAYPLIGSATTPLDAFLFFLLNTLRLSGAYHASAQAFEIPPRMGQIDIVNARFIRNAHEHNMAVHVWTINEITEMQRLIDMGVDGIMTDFPDRLLTLIGRDSVKSIEQ